MSCYFQTYRKIHYPQFSIICTSSRQQDHHSPRQNSLNTKPRNQKQSSVRNRVPPHSPKFKAGTQGCGATKKRSFSYNIARMYFQPYGKEPAIDSVYTSSYPIRVRTIRLHIIIKQRIRCVAVVIPQWIRDSKEI